MKDVEVEREYKTKAEVSTAIVKILDSFTRNTGVEIQTINITTVSHRTASGAVLQSTMSDLQFKMV